MRNENLLNTIMVKSQLKRWVSELALELDEVLYRLADQHLIVITKEELTQFLEENQIKPKDLKR